MRHILLPESWITSTTSSPGGLEALDGARTLEEVVRRTIVDDEDGGIERRTSSRIRVIVNT